MSRVRDLTDFRDAASGVGLLIYLVDVDDVLHQPLLVQARARWIAGIETKHHICLSCRGAFAGGARRPRLLLLATPDVTTPTLCGAASVCENCAKTLSSEALDRALSRTLRRIAPHATFENTQ